MKDVLELLLLAMFDENEIPVSSGHMAGIHIGLLHAMESGPWSHAGSSPAWSQLKPQPSDRQEQIAICASLR